MSNRVKVTKEPKERTTVAMIQSGDTWWIGLDSVYRCPKTQKFFVPKCVTAHAKQSPLHPLALNMSMGGTRIFGWPVARKPREETMTEQHVKVTLA